MGKSDGRAHQAPSMELLYTFLFFTFLLLLLLLFIIKPKTQKNPRLPPGPWQFPVIGSLHHLIFHPGLPHRILRDLARIYGPIMHLKLGEVPTIVVSSSEVTREIMTTHDVAFSSRPMINAIKVFGGKGIVFAPYGEYWRQLRKICVVELLTTRRVQSFRSVREEEVFALVRSISSSLDSTINLSQRFKSLANDITMRAVIGSKCRDQAMFLSALEEGLEIAGGFDLADLFPSSGPVVSLLNGSSRKLARIHRDVDRMLDDIIGEHEARRVVGEPADSLLDDLLGLLHEGGGVALTVDSIKAIILDIFGAGSESSATALVWAMTELVRNPRVMKKVQSEIRGVLLGEKKQDRRTKANDNELSYLKLVIKETLRLHVPGPLLIPRECGRTCEVLGYEIPAKTRVIVNAWAMGTDPQYWGSDAEEFRPERFEGSHIDYEGANFEFIPFGAGRRICPGISFGVANVEHTLAQILCYFNWELPGGALPCDLDMSETFGATARKKSDLHLTAIPRIPCPLI